MIISELNECSLGVTDEDIVQAMKGGGHSPPTVSFSEIIWSWVGAFCGIMPVATAIAAMHATKTLHPPGGATALIAVIGSQKIHNLGFYYVLVPVLAGAFIMLIVALLVNNLCKTRKYPEFWL